ncbi:hypothetical protein ED21_20289 [Erythrobacter sp. SD-21]|nr:hypothetical protein ED21_20289 [Erythrobacter sp. SD-21]
MRGQPNFARLAELLGERATALAKAHGRRKRLQGTARWRNAGLLWPTFMTRSR